MDEIEKLKKENEELRKKLLIVCEFLEKYTFTIYEANGKLASIIRGNIKAD